MKNYLRNRGKFIKVVYTLIICLTMCGFSDTVVLIVPLHFYKNQRAWDAVENELSWGVHKHVVLRWAGEGGYVYMLDTFLSSLSDAYSEGKIVDFEVIGPATSAHAMALCYAEHINIKTKQAPVLFHPIWAENFYDWPKPGTISFKSQHRFLDDCVKTGFLYPDEVDKIENQHKEVVLWPLKTGAQPEFQHIIARDAP